MQTWNVTLHGTVTRDIRRFEVDAETEDDARAICAAERPTYRVHEIAAQASRDRGEPAPQRSGPPTSPRFHAPRFTAADADRAHDDWGCNCGPSALAAICGLTLDAARPLMGDFEAKHYTNPTLMMASLDRVPGITWRRVKDLPDWGLVRVQWEGPWTQPGVPMRARYRHTHWIGTCASARGRGAFDVNAMSNGSGWCSWEHWQQILAPLIIRECVPRASGAWHFTHHIEVTVQ